MTDEQAGLDEQRTDTAPDDEAPEELEEGAEELDEEAKEADDAAKLKEAIDVQVEDVGTLRKKLVITVPQEAIEERLHEQFAELKRDALVPGFRKGRAPLVLVEKRFGAEVGDQLITKLVSASYLAAVEKVDIKPLGDPLIWAREDDEEKLLPIDKAVLNMKLPREGALEYAAEVELRPQFELPELDGIPVERPTVTVDDDDVEEELNRWRSSRGHFAPVTDGAVEEDDLVVVDLTLSVDGKVIKDEKNVTVAARAQVIDGIVLEDLGEAMVGKRPGDTVTAEAVVPDDHESIDYRGKTASFQAMLHDVKRLELPPLTDEFAETLGFENVADLRGQVRKMLESRLDSVVQDGLRGQIGKYLLDRCEMELPSGLSHRQTERLVARRKVALYQRGMAEQDIEKQTDALRARASEDAVRELKLFFIMEQVAEKMELEVHDDELNGAIARIAASQGKRFDRVRDELSKGEGLMALYLQIRDDKILDALLEKAVVTEVEGPKKKKTAKRKRTTKKKTSARANPKESQREPTDANEDD